MSDNGAVLTGGAAGPFFRNEYVIATAVIFALYLFGITWRPLVYMRGPWPRRHISSPGV
jgi:hypothetical protein